MKLTMVSKPPGDPIHPENTTFFYVSSNLINLDGLLENHIIPIGQGTPEENTVANVTVPIRVNSGDTYTITGYFRITYYDAAGEYVNDYSSTSTPPDTRVIPDNVAYARVSVLTTRLDRVQMNLGTELLPYEPGNTPYIPASYLDASGMQNRLNLDVGTRIFAGDIMIYGDTGLRNITDMIPSQVYGSTLSVQRYANMVYLNLNSISLTTGTNASFILPNGFRPSTNGTLRKETANGYVDLSNNGQITINPNTAAYNTAQIIYVTRDSWPTTLPGIPA